MIQFQKSQSRRHSIQGGVETWQSCDAGAFRTLESFREECLAPGASFEFVPAHSLEVLTTVLTGTLVLWDSGGRSISLETGECHRSGAKPGALQRGVNGSLQDPARIFQFLITPDRKAVQMPAAKRRFPLADRRGVLRLLVSRSGRDASLRLRQDASVYSAILDPGHHLVHPIAPSRGAWLHVVSGRLQLADYVLEAGDAVSLVEEAAVSMTSQGPSEILLLDLL
jgi:quercetin 2,3-dioxygenase